MKWAVLLAYVGAAAALTAPSSVLFLQSVQISTNWLQTVQHKLPGVGGHKTGVVWRHGPGHCCCCLSRHSKHLAADAHPVAAFASSKVPQKGVGVQLQPHGYPTQQRLPQVLHGPDILLQGCCKPWDLAGPGVGAVQGARQASLRLRQQQQAAQPLSGVFGVTAERGRAILATTHPGAGAC